MKHIIELDQRMEQILNAYAMHSRKTEKDILSQAVTHFLQQQMKQKKLRKKT